MVHLTGGRWKGRTLATPSSQRPTGAKIRLAIGNILREVLPGARVLDGFAGSGALGFEALSRGAAFVAFVDSDTDAVMAIRDNIERLGQELPRSAWRVLHLDIERGIRDLADAAGPFDLVFLDPPYRSDEGKKALNALVQYAILAPSGIVVVEHHRGTALPPTLGSLEQFKRHRYGDTVLSFYLNTAKRPPAPG
jgi:16S rRNA (guanine966-N2)-methyltransferase